MRKTRVISILLVLVLLLTLMPTNVYAANENDSTMYVVKFNLNYKGADKLKSITVKKNDVINPENAPKTPTRKGYKFAGWYTSKKPILKNGISKDEWIFGKKYSEWAGVTPHKGEVVSMPVTKNVVLYARWVKPTSIASANDLIKIKEDLSGWYVLKNDIDLSGIENWKPIGVYDLTYEWGDAPWWVLAFRGTLDGKGYSISGLKINKALSPAVGLFGAISNAEIKNLRIKDYEIKVTYDKWAYVSTLAAFVHGNTKITNCHTDGVVEVNINENELDYIFVAATGLVGGGWGGTINKCSVSGDITLNANVKNGGDMNVGGLVGEGYMRTMNSTSDANITCNASSDSKPKKGSEDMTLSAFVGGIQAGSTYIVNCTTSGEIVGGVKKDKGLMSLNIGGISGSERYGFVENCRSDANITITEGRYVYAGGIVGSFSSQYGLIGYYSGIRDYNIFNCVVTGKITVEDGYTREVDGLRLGAAVSEVPKALKGSLHPSLPSVNEEGIYKVEHVAYVDYYNGETLNDSNETIVSYKSIEELSGDVLKTLLGTDDWIFENGKIPTPIILKEWSYKSKRMS